MYITFRGPHNVTKQMIPNKMFQKRPTALRSEGKNEAIKKEKRGRNQWILLFSHFFNYFSFIRFFFFPPLALILLLAYAPTERRESRRYRERKGEEKIYIYIYMYIERENRRGCERRIGF